MQVTITEDSDNKITVTEYLEPTFACYTIQQGLEKIELNEYQLKELVRTLKFISRHDD